jgi:hypothetical protein
MLTADCSVLNTWSFLSTSDRSAFDSHSAPYLDCSLYDTWLFVPLTDCSALFTLCPVLVADCSALSTYCSALGPSGIPYSTPQVKLFRFTGGCFWWFHSSKHSSLRNKPIDTRSTSSHPAVPAVEVLQLRNHRNSLSRLEEGIPFSYSRPRLEC